MAIDEENGGDGFLREVLRVFVHDRAARIMPGVMAEAGAPIAQDIEGHRRQAMRLHMERGFGNPAFRFARNALNGISHGNLSLNPRIVVVFVAGSGVAMDAFDEQIVGAQICASIRRTRE